LTTTGTIEEQLGHVVHITGIGIQDEVADAFGQGSTTRFSSEDRIRASLP